MYMTTNKPKNAILDMFNILMLGTSKASLLANQSDAFETPVFLANTNPPVNLGKEQIHHRYNNQREECGKSKAKDHCP